MKKVILFMAGILASMMLNAQSRWSVTPEAGLVVNKENEGTSVTLGFKAGAGVLYQLKEGVGKKPSFGLKSGVYILMQKGGYHPMSWGNISTGGGFSMDYEKTNVESTRYYLQLPVMAHWGFKLCDDVRLKLAVGPYVAVGIGGRTNAYVSSSKYNIDEETGVGQYEYRNDYYRFGTFKGKTVNEEFGFEASPRLDWGGTASVGIAVKRISFTIGYDLAWGKYNKEQNDLRIRNHMVTFLWFSGLPVCFYGLGCVRCGPTVPCTAVRVGDAVLRFHFHSFLVVIHSCGCRSPQYCPGRQNPFSVSSAGFR